MDAKRASWAFMPAHINDLLTGVTGFASDFGYTKRGFGFGWQGIRSKVARNVDGADSN